MDRAVIKNQALRALYKAADSFTSRDPVKVPGIKGEAGSANLHPRAAGATSDEEKTAAATCCASPKMAPRRGGKRVKLANGPGAAAMAGVADKVMHNSGLQPAGPNADLGFAKSMLGKPPVDQQALTNVMTGGLAGSMALPGLIGAGVGAGYGALNPGRDEEGNKRSRLLSALKHGLLGGVGGAAAGPLGVMGGLGGAVTGAALTKNSVALPVKLAMLTTQPQKQTLPVGQGATQRQRDQAQATLKQNGRII